MPEPSAFQHPEWEVVPDRRGEAELSLDALRNAFANTFSSDSTESREPAAQTDLHAECPQGHEETELAPDASEHSEHSESEAVVENGSATQDGGTADSVGGEESEEELRRLNPLAILEAMLFTGGPGGRPLTAACACRSMRGVTADEIPGYVARLNTKYAESGRAFEIVLSGDGYRLVLRPEYASIRSLFQGRVREARLSQAAVQVLAIVAWRQPITADEVSALRDGAPSQSLLSQLVRRRLLQIERPENERIAVYRTTERFLELFHIRSLADLPQSDDF